MSEKSFNRGDSICYICKSFIFSHVDAFFHGAPFHVECLNDIGNGWMATLEPDPVPFFMWIGEHWILGNMEFVVSNGQLSLYLDRDWENDPFVEVLDDSENPPEVIEIDSDSEVETINSEEEEINGSDSEDANTIVISSDDEVSADGNNSISEEEADATESESVVDASEVSSGYGTLTFDDWMDLSLASSPEENDEY